MSNCFRDSTVSSYEIYLNIQSYLMPRLLKITTFALKKVVSLSDYMTDWKSFSQIT